MNAQNWWKIPAHLSVKQNQLQIAQKNTSTLAEKYGTPLYVYNAQRIQENFQRLRNAFLSAGVNPRIHYAMKANSHLRILQLLKKEGAWIDTVSPHEVRLALLAGFSKNKIVFTGTSVSNEDLDGVIALGVGMNVDSLSQLRRLHTRGYKKPVSLRWNPGIGAGFHEHVITAGKFIKFGIPEKKIVEVVKQAVEYGIPIHGLHQHIGSGWLGKDVQAFLSTVSKTLEVAQKIQSITGKKLAFIDFGGGPGIRYHKEQQSFPIEAYAKGIATAVKKSKMKIQIVIEPGRYLVGDAGILLMEVNTVEEKNIPIIGVNAGFNSLIRPAFYGAHHEIINCQNVNGAKNKKYLIAGNLCESSDVFNTNKKELRALPKTNEGDILAILNAGAYGMSMASTYNMRAHPAEVMIQNGKDFLITKRDSFKDLIRNQR